MIRICQEGRVIDISSIWSYRWAIGDEMALLCNGNIFAIKSCGAQVEKNTGIDRFPNRLVEDAISLAPSQIALAGRNPDYDILVGNTKTAFVNFGGNINVIDPYTGVFRRSTKKDAGDAARLCDALKEINIEMAQAAVGVEINSNSRKPISFVTCVTSPLKLTRKFCEVVMVPGIASDSKQPDLQAAYEKALTGVPAAMPGANMVIGMGGIETGLTFDYGQAVLDDRILYRNPLKCRCKPFWRKLKKRTGSHQFESSPISRASR